MLRLVEFLNKNKIRLPGLLYEPAQRTKKVLINLHGNGSASVFYSVQRSNAFGKHLSDLGISFFAFNNIGAHYIKSLKKVIGDKEERVKLGTAYELIRECEYDIDGAVEFLQGLGYQEFYLIGHSTGANKICVYNYYKPKNIFSKFILAAGGDDAGVLYDMLGEKKFKSALQQCKKYIEAGKGRKLIPKYLMEYIISYQSLFDTINPDGDYNTFPFNEAFRKKELAKKELFREVKSIKKPALVIYGENDEYCYGDVAKCVGLIQDAVKNKENFDFKIIEGADHSFHEKEEKFAGYVSDWLLN